MSKDNKELNESNEIPTQKVNMMSETEAISFCVTITKAYLVMENKLRKQYNDLVKIKESFPIKYLESDDFEDFLLQASSAKFKAIILSRKLFGLSSEINNELSYITSNFKLYTADDALSEKFDKITEGLREAYINSNFEIKELSKIKDKVKGLADSAEKMIKMFDSDEINFRRIAEKKNKLLGFS